MARTGYDPGMRCTTVGAWIALSLTQICGAQSTVSRVEPVSLTVRRTPKIEGVQVFGEPGVELQLAMGHDMSQKGALLVTGEALVVGATVEIRMNLPPDSDDEHVLMGRVVRSGENVADPDGLWPYEAAVEFDEAVPEVESLLQKTLERREGAESVLPEGDA